MCQLFIIISIFVYCFFFSRQVSKVVELSVSGEKAFTILGVVIVQEMKVKQKLNDVMRYERRAHIAYAI